MVFDVGGFFCVYYLKTDTLVRAGVVSEVKKKSCKKKKMSGKSQSNKGKSNLWIKK